MRPLVVYVHVYIDLINNYGHVAEAIVSHPMIWHYRNSYINGVLKV